MAQRLLRQKTSGHIYIWAPHFAERDDMEEYFPEGQAPVEEKQEEKPKKAAKSKGRAKEAVVDEPPVETEIADILDGLDDVKGE